MFPGLPTLDFFGLGGSPGPPATETLDFANGGISTSVSVDVPTAFSFTGYNGGPILLPGDNVASFLGTETIYYTITGGNITPEVPEPSSFVVVLGLMALMSLVRRRRLAAAR